jgi:hypothetical protein
MRSTDGPIESAMISCPAGHHFHGAIAGTVIVAAAATARLEEPADISGILAGSPGSRLTSPAAETEQLRQMAGPAFMLPSVHRWAGAVTASSADRPTSRHTDGSAYADVYLPGPCTGR